MSEQSDVIDTMGKAGVLAAIEWAASSAYRRVLDDYDPDTGHSKAWVGLSAFSILTDRQDRVFSCGKFAVHSDGPVDVGRDLLQIGLRSQDDFDLMPVVSPGVVVRDDLNGSPGWRFGDWRWLVSSVQFGRSDDIRWKQKSPTKQRVASQFNPDELFLFSDEDFGLPPLSVLSAPIATLILAHSVDTDTGARELFLGRSRLNEDGSHGWHWKVNLLRGLTLSSDGSNSDQPVPSGSHDAGQVPDVDVRLRATATDRKSGSNE